MLDVPVDQRTIRNFYSVAAPFYDDQTAKFESKPKALAVELLSRQRGERYLEVAVGTGASFAAVTGPSGIEGAVGVDLAPGMLKVAAGRLAEEGVTRPPFMFGDARSLPFADASFDCLFNSYMLDLIPTAEIPHVLESFRRVLRAGGRLVLVNLTEGEGEDVAFSDNWKDRYQQDPAALGACRPVVVGSMLEAAGFVDIERRYEGGESWPSEIVTARAP